MPSEATPPEGTPPPVDQAPADEPRVVEGAPFAVARRLHPFSLLFDGIRTARRLILPAILGGASAGRGDLGQILLWGGLFMAVPAFLMGLTRFLVFRYRIAGTDVVLDSGLLNRRRRIVPLARVQNVEVRQSALQQAVGVAELAVETASGVKSEEILLVLALHEAEALRGELLARRRRTRADAAAPAVEEEVPVEPLARLSTGRLVVAGATANQAGVIAALLAGGLQFIYQLPIDLPEQLGDPTVLLPEVTPWTIALLVLGAAVLFIFLGWVFSIIGSVVRYYGYHLELAGPELRKRFGLFTRRQGFVPLERVQAVRVEESLIRRPFGLCALKVETAGGTFGQRGGAEAFLPLAPVERAGELVQAVFDDLDYGRLDFHRVHPRARRRAAIRYTVPVIVATAALAVALGIAWLAILALLPLCLVAAHLHYRNLGYALAPGYVMARRGFFNRITWVIPERKIQTVHVEETPLQRRHGLATLAVDTAAGAATIVDLGRPDALRLMVEVAERLPARIAATARGDGGAPQPPAADDTSREGAPR